MKKTAICLLLCLLTLLTACGVKNKQTQEEYELGSNEIYIYYQSLDQNDLSEKPFKLKKNEDVLVCVDNIITALSDVEEKDKFLSPIPKEMIYKSCNHGQRKGNIEVHFDVVYDSITAENLLFFKACVTKSILNLEGVNSVTLYLTDLANSDLETATISEYFDDDSFNMVFDKENGYTQKGAITVYFASQDGKVLKEYRKTVEISNNTSLPKLVLETLIAGPESEDYRATVSSKVKVQKITVKDGICYVDLSDEFYDSDNTLSNDIIIYSIVDSLVELPGVSKVQFLRNGEKQSLFRESLPFDGLFERNLDLIEQEETTQEETTEEILEENNTKE